MPSVEARAGAAPLQASGVMAFPVVGIGASAGGLEAFEQFFRNAPPDSGMAFVMVQHLDPGHASILSEILQRSTTMPVVEVQDGIKVEPNCVYVVPPNREMSILRGLLHLTVPDAPRGRRMPIDAFLRSLAEDQDSNAVGIILSGTGTDGTLGLRAILGGGGLTLVQDPTTAKFDGMPASAIQAGYASLILPVEKMPEALLACTRTLAPRKPTPPTLMERIETPLAPALTSGMNRILMLLRSAMGNDFSLYKKSTIGRRIERRMAQHDITDTEVYLRYLKENPAEVRTLFRELLINVTSFFRDPEVFDVLKKEVLPRLLKDRQPDYVFRAWVAGCASGEEAYSLAIILREFMDETQQEFQAQLYATDLDDEAVAIARAGVYPPNIALDVTPERLRRFFARDDGGNYRVKKEIREMVVFAIQNVTKDPPFTKLDVLCCRNLMIYLEPEMQNRLIPAFHYALKPGGALVLSPSESIGNHPELFSAVNRKWKIYRALHTLNARRSEDARDKVRVAAEGTRVYNEPTTKTRESNLPDLARRALLQTFAPASVVTDVRGHILYVHGDTGRYLRPAPGQPTHDVVAMTCEGLQLELRTAVQAAAQGTPTLNREVTFTSHGGPQVVSLSVRALPDPEAGAGLLLVSFVDVGRPAIPAPVGKRPARSATSRRIVELERELANTKDNLQATIEEQQASNEELKSTNEEIQSTNEELQSTNEELETSKEELQSVNEELVTVNGELQSKIEQLAGMQNDMRNLLDNISVGTIFLDEHLVIRRFTREATSVYRLVATDVGRPLADIKSDIDGDAVLEAARGVLDTLVPGECEVRTSGGTSYLTRIHPYRTLDNVIEGVVLTLTDITKHVEAENAVRGARSLAEGIVDTVIDPLLVLDGKLTVITASRSFYHRFRVEPSKTVGRAIYDLGNGQWNIPALRKLLETILPRNESFDGYVVEHDFPEIGRRRIILNARRLRDPSGQNPLILLAMAELTDPAS